MEKLDPINPHTIDQPILHPVYSQNGIPYVATQNSSVQVPMMPTVISQPLQPVFGPFPNPVKCPHCFNTGISETVYVTGLGTYLLCGGCCLLG